MNFLSSLTKSAGGQSADEPKKTAGEEASTTDLFSSAKVLAEAAQSQYNKDSGKIDNKKVAEAAADVLDAAQKYGKLDETQGVGQYVEKAETYLHQYGSANPSTTTDAAAAKPPAAVPATEETKVPAPTAEDTEETKAPAPAPADTEEPKAPAPASAGEEKGSDYLKMAGDFLGKK